MRIIDVKQGTDEWLDWRLGKVTASEVDALISPVKWEIKTGEGPKTYLATKLAENWLCNQVATAGTWSMDQGALMEVRARAWYKMKYDCEIKEVGFIVGDDGRCGCSPDGLLLPDYGIEIKAPQPIAAAKYAVAGILPPEYSAQVHFSMFVTGFKRWVFVSYHSKLPKLVVEVQRDEEKIAIIKKALTGFYARFDESWEKLNATADEPRANPYLKTT